VPALRGETVTLAGDFHRAENLEIRPRCPQSIPLMLGSHGPRTMRRAARCADVWSGCAPETSDPEAFVLRAGRGPLGRPVGNDRAVLRAGDSHLGSRLR